MSYHTRPQYLTSTHAQKLNSYAHYQTLQQNAAAGVVKTLARRYGSVDRTERDGRQWSAGLFQTASGLAGEGKRTDWGVHRLGAHSET